MTVELPTELDFTSNHWTRAGTWTCNHAELKVDIEACADWTEVVYLIMDSDGLAQRVGTSQNKLGDRLNRMAGDVTRALQGRDKSGNLSPKEPAMWIEFGQGGGNILAHKPQPVWTAGVQIAPFLDLERALIRKLKSEGRARLNRSFR